MQTVYFKARVAHFSMPPLKAEGWTWPVPPPSALRGAIEAILYKPEVYVDVRTIHVLKPIRYLRCKVNGLKDRASRDGRVVTESHQMNNVMLYDVAYVVDFDLRLCRREGGEVVEFDPPPSADQNLTKYVEMYSNRITRGKNFRQPYLGSKFCPADFGTPPSHVESTAGSADFGQLVHGIEYRRTGDTTHMFHAKMTDGVVKVPSFFDVLRRRRAEEP